jgi:hypothetical protein
VSRERSTAFFARRDGSLVLSDLKTAQDLSYSWGSIAIQLAFYAGAAAMFDCRTNTREPMPDVDKQHALVVHVPAGKGECVVYEIDFRAGFEGTALCLAVKDWRKRDRFATPLLDSNRERVIAAIRGLTATQRGALARTWPAGVPTLKQSRDHTFAQLWAIGKALTAVTTGGAAWKPNPSIGTRTEAPTSRSG